MECLERWAFQVPLVPRDHLDVQVIPDKVLLGLLVHQVLQGMVDQDRKETEENQDLPLAQRVHTTQDPLDLQDLQDKRDQQELLDLEVNLETQFLTAECRLCRDLQVPQDRLGAKDHKASKVIPEYLAYLEAQCRLLQARLVPQVPQDHVDRPVPSLLPARCGSISLIT